MTSSILNEMTSQKVIKLYKKLESLEIFIWIDGGWAVDALLEKQTRPHKDLDIVIQQKDVEKLQQVLQEQAYKDVPQDDTGPWNFVLGDNSGHLIDVHVIELDAAGHGIYGPKERNVFYPASSLSGEGMIEGTKIRCISADYMVQSRTGYQWQEKDFKDVQALCEKFGITYPQDYIDFIK